MGDGCHRVSNVTLRMRRAVHLRTPSHPYPSEQAIVTTWKVFCRQKTSSWLAVYLMLTSHVLWSRKLGQRWNFILGLGFTRKQANFPYVACKRPHPASEFRNRHATELFPFSGTHSAIPDSNQNPLRPKPTVDTWITHKWIIYMGIKLETRVMRRNSLDYTSST